MRESPTEDQMATIYSAIRNGDSLRTACKILGLSYSRVNYWVKEGKRARKKKRWGDSLTKDENNCLKFVNLMRSADRRKRR